MLSSVVTALSDLITLPHCLFQDRHSLGDLHIELQYLRLFHKTKTCLCVYTIKKLHIFVYLTRIQFFDFVNRVKLDTSFC